MWRWEIDARSLWSTDGPYDVLHSLALGKEHIWHRQEMYHDPTLESPHSGRTMSIAGGEDEYIRLGKATLRAIHLC